MRVVIRVTVRKFRKFISDENAATAVEYAVMIAMIVLICMYSIQALGTTARQTFSMSESAISNS